MSILRKYVKTAHKSGGGTFPTLSEVDGAIGSQRISLKRLVKYRESERVARDWVGKVLQEEKNLGQPSTTVEKVQESENEGEALSQIDLSLNEGERREGKEAENESERRVTRTRRLSPSLPFSFPHPPPPSSSPPNNNNKSNTRSSSNSHIQVPRALNKSPKISSLLTQDISLSPTSSESPVYTPHPKGRRTLLDVYIPSRTRTKRGGYRTPTWAC